MKKMICKQRRMGAVLAGLSLAVLIWMIATGGGDATGVGVVMGLGVCLMTTRECVLYEPGKEGKILRCAQDDKRKGAQDDKKGAQDDKGKGRMTEVRRYG